MTMTIRQALEVFGPKRVRRGMRAFEGDVDRNAHTWKHCFVGNAVHGGRWGDGMVALWGLLGPRRDHAISVLGRAFVFKTCGDRDRLYGEAVAYLAEHGVAIEPSVTLAEPSHV